MNKSDIEAYADRLIAGHDIVFSSSTLEGIKSTSKKDLKAFHNSLGTKIRNVYQLWSIKWEPVYENYVDVSPDHPDQVSMRIIEAFWKKLQK